MEGKCKDQACVPFFLHENAMMHYNRANKRMLIALVSVLAFVTVMIGIFVYGNTVREKQLIDLVDKRIVEVENAKDTTTPGL